MNFKKVLAEGCFCLDLKGETKNAIIEEMVDLLVAAGKITDKDAALSSVLDRERKMSTGMQFGVALPHGKTIAVGELVAALALKKRGIDFSSLDGEPSTIFIMTISPANQTGPHMQYLSEISKLLSNPAIRERLLDAASEGDILRILLNDPGLI